MTDLTKVWRIQDKIELAAAAILFLSPWIFQFADVSDAAWNAWLCGGAVAVLSLAALFALNRWEEWHGIALGAWLIISPWTLEFSALIEAVAVNLIIGSIFIASSAWEIWQLRHPEAIAEPE